VTHLSIPLRFEGIVGAVALALDGEQATYRFALAYAMTLLKPLRGLACAAVTGRAVIQKISRGIVK
jgi:hypothetical protein